MTCIAFTADLLGSGAVKMSNKTTSKSKGVRHLPECSVCLVHFTVSGDQAEAAGLDSTLVPLLLCQLGAASIHTGIREEVDDTSRVESAGSRSLGVNELLVGVG